MVQGGTLQARSWSSLSAAGSSRTFLRLSFVKGSKPSPALHALLCPCLLLTIWRLLQNLALLTEGVDRRAGGACLLLDLDLARPALP